MCVFAATEGNITKGGEGEEQCDGHYRDRCASMLKDKPVLVINSYLYTF